MSSPQDESDIDFVWIDKTASATNIVAISSMHDFLHKI